MGIFNTTKVKRALWFVNYPFTIATKDSARPKLFGHFLRDSLYCFIIVYKGFCPKTENSFTKTVKDYVKGFVIHIETDNYLFTERNDIFKEKNLQWMIYTRHSPSWTELTSFPYKL